MQRAFSLWVVAHLSITLSGTVQLTTAAAGDPVKQLILPGESFVVDGCPAFILLPPEEKRAMPQPWVMYAPTLPGLPDEHEKWMHEQFLAAGVAVAGIDIGEAYGPGFFRCPELIDFVIKAARAAHNQPRSTFAAARSSRKLIFPCATRSVPHAQQTDLRRCKTIIVGFRGAKADSIGNLLSYRS